MTNLLQALLMLVIHLNEGKQREVVARAQSIQMRAKITCKRFVVTCGFRQSVCILGIRKQLDAILLEERFFRRKRSRLLVFCS